MLNLRDSKGGSWGMGGPFVFPPNEADMFSLPSRERIFSERFFSPKVRMIFFFIYSDTENLISYPSLALLISECFLFFKAEPLCECLDSTWVRPMEQGTTKPGNDIERCEVK